MKNLNSLFFAIIFILINNIVNAQPSVSLRTGTVISVILNEEIHSRDAHIGQMIDFVVQRDVLIDEHIVIAEGTLAKGKIVRLPESSEKEWASISIEVNNIFSIDGQQINLKSIPYKVRANCNRKLCEKSSKKCHSECRRKSNNITIHSGTKLRAMVKKDVKINLR